MQTFGFQAVGVNNPQSPIGCKHIDVVGYPHSRGSTILAIVLPFVLGGSKDANPKKQGSPAITS